MLSDKAYLARPAAWMLHGPLTALMIGTSTASTFSTSMRPYHAFSSSSMSPSGPSIAR